MPITTTKKITYTGILTAVCFVFTAFISIPSLSGGHTNLSDAIIFIASYTLGPVSAFVVGGLGTFFADFFFYPTTMFISLVIHGTEGLILGLLFKTVRGKKYELIFDILYMIVAGLFMMGGFFLAKTFIYGNLETALVSLYRNALQVITSIAVALLVIPHLSFTARRAKKEQKPPAENKSNER